MTRSTNAAVATACRLIEQSEEAPALATMAALAGMSRFHFHRTFKAATGLTPKAYADSRRASRVRDRLARSGTVTEAIYGAGFRSNSRFYATSTRMLGMTPTDFRAGGANLAIRFVVGECSLGSILVATTDKGVCAILLGADPDALPHDLQVRFPHARLTGGDDSFERLVAEVVGLVEVPAIGLELPLDIRGTALQERVWQALRDLSTDAERCSGPSSPATRGTDRVPRAAWPRQPSP